ncbi:MAG: S26 family signal peptidase [Thermoguttaceae bacterium]|jgi:TM2 domain-containing membrane protein YozV|nr:S26 family signal peptidase [Thermoguttaceae bacterium]
MRCPSCEFQNIPGTVVCGRCGARLDLPAAEIGVHPPRAGRTQKVLRRWFPLYAWRHRVSFWLDSLHLGPMPTLAWPRRAAGGLVCMVVPGGAQFYLGRTRRGWAFLGAFVACLGWGVLFFGTTMGNVLLGLALSAHLSSMIDAIWSGSHQTQTRLEYLAVTACAVAVVVYWPVVALVGRYASFVRIQANTPPFVQGDVVVYNRSAYAGSPPEVGDVVLYEIARLQIGNYLIQGARIDRILAGPGQTVAFQNAQPIIDGVPSAWMPLNVHRVPAFGEMRVPEGSYFILPSTDPVLPVEQMTRAAVVPATAIRGKAVWLHRPLGRWSRVR